MAKELLDELLEELHKLKDEELAKAQKELEEGYIPGMPLSPSTVLKKVNEVVRHNQVTAEELSFLTSWKGMDATNAQVIKDYAETLERE